MSRRGLLKAAASLATFATLPAALANVEDDKTRRSHHGFLKVDLQVKLARNVIPGMAPAGVSRPDDGLIREVHTRTYDGMIPGPTLRVRRGDTLQLRLFNELRGLADIPMMDDDMNRPHEFNVTNVHVHGLHVSPRDNSDNVFIEIPPGEFFEYEYKIPEHHPDGTYWFHPHHHGAVAFQFMGGMAGALLIKGPTDDALRDYFGKIEERLLVLQQIRVNNDPTFGLGEVPLIRNFLDLTLAPLFTVNGQVNPTIRMQPGEVQRWRFIHAGMTEHFPLELRPVPSDEQDEPEPLPLYPIAYDGITLAKPEETTRIFMASGNRIDVLVQAPQQAGVYELWKPQLDQGLVPEPGACRFMATVIVQGRSISMPSPAALSSLPAPFEDIMDRELAPQQMLPHRVITWGEDFSPILTPIGPDPTKGFPRFLIGGRYAYDRSQDQVLPLDDGTLLQFDAERLDQIIRLGSVEEWEIVNPGFVDHSFHIHQFSFQVTKINGQKLNPPKWYDTINVPRRSTPFDPPGSVTFRARIEGVKGNEDDIVGKFVLHCHLLDHEDLGMMQVVEVEL